MYLGIDIGGSKTLIAKLSSEGVIIQKTKYVTSKLYPEFLKSLRLSDYSHTDYKCAVVAAPGNINRKEGTVVNFGNLDWENVPLASDIEKIFNCPVLIENDAKLAALSESMLVKNTYSRVLYVTVSTGIGYAFVHNQKIDLDVGDTGGKAMLFNKNNQFMPWEEYASGKSIVSRFGKMAKDIKDEATWKIIAKNLSDGLIELIAIFEPEVIIFGGSVGEYFDRYGKFLETYLKQRHIPLVSLPNLIKAQRPNEAVIFGCFDYAKQFFDF